jgi:hypothetical protein
MKSPGSGLIDKFEIIAPAEAGAATYDVNDGFEFAVMVRAGFGLRMDNHCASPKFLRADLGVGDRFGASHAGSLRSVGVKLPGTHDADSVTLPVGVCRSGHLKFLACAVLPPVKELSSFLQNSTLLRAATTPPGSPPDR